MARVARAMAMATKRTMVTGRDNTSNGYSEEGCRQALAATIAMGMGMARRTRPLAL